MVKKKKILITGGLGYIGSSLLRNLDKKIVGEVIILDNLVSQRYPSLFDLPKGFKFKFVKDDIMTADFGKHLSGVDAVIHLAAIVDAEGSYKIPKQVDKINYRGLKRVADACLTHNVRLFFPSTTSIYGSQSSIVDETCKELKPQSPYAESKLLAEKYLEKLGGKGLKYTVCRFGTIFGHSVGIHYDTVVDKFVWQAACGEPLTVWKTAWKQERPYLYLGDAVGAINFIIKNDLFNGELYNVLTDNFTVRELVKTIKSELLNLKIIHVNSPIMNKLSYKVDDKKFRSLGFKPSGNIKTGVKDLIAPLKGIIQE